MKIFRKDEFRKKFSIAPLLPKDVLLRAKINILWMPYPFLVFFFPFSLFLRREKAKIVKDRYKRRKLLIVVNNQKCLIERTECHSEAEFMNVQFH